jgi:hypothetical protein
MINIFYGKSPKFRDLMHFDLNKDLPTVKIFNFSRGELIKDELRRSLYASFFQLLTVVNGYEIEKSLWLRSICIFFNSPQLKAKILTVNFFLVKNQTTEMYHFFERNVSHIHIQF